MKVYISGCIYENDKAQEQFNKAKEEVLIWAEQVENPLDDIDPVNYDWNKGMRSSLKKMLECDSVYMIEGWQQSQESLIEKFLADQLEMYVFYQKSN